MFLRERTEYMRWGMGKGIMITFVVYSEGSGGQPGGQQGRGYTK